MARTMRQHAPITEPRILGLINECKAKITSIGFIIPANIKFFQCKAFRRAGLARYVDNSVILSTFIYKEKDDAIKAIIYHEIGHLIAGPRAHHGPEWLKVVNKISRATGIKITRCYSDADLPVHAEEKKLAWKYNFRCKDCGSVIHLTRRTEFVRTYNEILPSGSPRWTCARCGGTFELLDNGK